MADGVSEGAELDVSESGHRTWWGLLALLPLCFFAWTGWRGLDFGQYWDDALHRGNQHHAVETGRLLPGWYNYPSVTFWIGAAALAPELADRPWERMRILHERRVGEPLHDQSAERGTPLPLDEPGLHEAIDSPAWALRARGLSLLLASLTILWLYLLGSTLGGAGQGLWAAAVGATSFELAYHSRWLAPDPVMTQFATLALLLLVRARRAGTSLLPAAAATGLALGTKYTAGILLAPLLVVWWQQRRDRRTAEIAWALAVAALVFLVTTPGALIEPQLFLRDVLWETRHYGIGHYGYTVEPGWMHTSLALEYLGLNLGSAWPPLAAMVTLLALAGVIQRARRNSGETLVLLVVPVLLLFVLTRQRVLFARNLLVFLPFLVLFASEGALWLGRFFQRAAVPAGLAAALVVPGAWKLHQSATAIEGRSASTLAEEVLTWASDETRTVHYTSGVRALLDQCGRPLPQDAAPSLEGAELVAFFPRDLAEGGNPELLRSNLPGLPEAVLGAPSVRWSWYTTWREEPVVVLRREDLDQLEGWRAWLALPSEEQP